MEFIVKNRDTSLSGEYHEVVFLTTDRWNDFSFVTQFYMTAYDSGGNIHDIGSVKIGFKGQTTEIATFEKLKDPFTKIGADFFL